MTSTRGIRTIADVRDRCRVDDITGCWHWSQGWVRNQPRVCVCGQVQNGPRVAWKLAGKAIPDGHLVYIDCETPGCLNPAHMGTATRAELGRIWASKGRLRGDPARAARSALVSRRRRSSLTVDDVMAIRASDGTNVELAAIYGVTPSSIGAIRRGTRWKLAANASVFSWARAAA